MSSLRGEHQRIQEALMALEAHVLGRLHAEDLSARSAKTFHSRFKAAKPELIGLAESLADNVQMDFALLKERWPTPS